MDMRDLGVILLWGGGLVLAGVLLARIRGGAWSAEALEQPPSVGPLVKGGALLGSGLLLAAVVLILGSFL